jgi:hypothetical protein
MPDLPPARRTFSEILRHSFAFLGHFKSFFAGRLNQAQLMIAVS